MSASKPSPPRGRKASVTSAIVQSSPGAHEPRIEYAKVIKLFVNEHTAELQDRQIAAVRRVVRVNADGYKLSELPDVCALIDVCAAGVTADNTVLVPSLVELINIFQKPLVVEKANQELHATEDVCSMFRLMARMLSVASPLVQLAAVESLFFLASVDDFIDGARAAEDTRASLWEHNHKLFYVSGVIPTIVTAFKSEVDELLRADVNKDGTVDASEYYKFKVLNDGDAANDEDTLAAAQARHAAEAKTADPESGEDCLTEPLPYFLVSVVKLLKELSEHAPSAAVIVRLGALQRCAQLVKVIADFREEVLIHTLELMWNCLEHSFDAIENGDVSLSLKDLMDKRRHANAAYTLGTSDAVIALKTLLQRTLADGNRKSDKQLRNTAVIIATLLAKRKENRVLFLEAGFVDLVLLYGCAAEMGITVDTNPRHFNSTEPEDLEFKVLLWSFVGVVTGVCGLGGEQRPPSHKPYELPPQNEQYESEREAVLASVRASLFLHTLLTYLDPLQSQTHAYIRAWSAAQGRALDLVALRLLHALAPRCLEAFLEASGPQVLALYVRKYSGVLSLSASASTVDPAHAAALTDGDADIDRVYLSLRVLQAVVATANATWSQPPFSGLLGEIGFVEDLVTIVKSIDVSTAKAPFASTTKAPTSASVTVKADTACPTDITPVASLETVFFLLGGMCDSHIGNQNRFRHCGGVQQLVAWLRFPTGDTASKPQVVLAAVHCLWNAVAANTKSENKFVAEGGVDALIDLIEACPEWMRGQTLGCLADLAANPNVVPYMKIWKSDVNGRSFASLILSFWPDDVSASSEPSGTVSEAIDGRDSPSSTTAFDRLRRALKASKMWKQVTPSQPEQTVVARVLADDLRPKIYAVLSVLGFENAEDGVVGNFDDLSPKERAVLCTVSRFPESVYGREWAAVLVRLANRGLTPIDADTSIAETELQHSSAAASEVAVQCEQLHDTARQKMSEEDEKFFGNVLSRRAAEEQSFSLAKRRIGMGSMGLQEWLAAKSRLGNSLKRTKK